MRDLNDVLDLNLRLPIGGKTYTVHPPSAAVGADLLNKLALGMAAQAGVDMTEARGQIAVTEDDMPDFGRQCLGAAYDEMFADGLSYPVIEFAVTTAFLAWTVGKDYAETWWEAGGQMGKAPAPNRAARRARPRTATPTPAGAARTSQTSASPSGTTARTKKPRKG